MRTPRGERTRQHILEEARRLFFDRGFRAVTMDEIANRLGMSKKTIYRFFSSKEDLLRGVMLEMVRDVEAKVNATVEDSQSSFLDKLHQLFAFVGLQVVQLRQPILDDIRRSAMTVWEEFDAWRQKQVLGRFDALIRQGVAEGVLRNDLNPHLLVVIYAALVRRVISPEVLTQLPLSAAEAFETVLRVFFEGILTENARGSWPGVLSPEETTSEKRTRASNDPGIDRKVEL